MAWYPKLRHGGLLAGHDFLDQDDLFRIDRHSTQNWSICGNGTVNRGAVKGAVLTFARYHQMKVFHTLSALKDGPYPSWILSPKGKQLVDRD